MPISQNYEQVMFDDGLPVKVQVERLDCFRLHWHYHPELLYVVKGAITLHIRGQSYTLQAHQMMFIDSTEVHSMDCFQEESLLLAVQFDADFFGQLPGLKGMKFRSENFASDQNQDAFVFDELRTLITRVVRAYTKRPKGYCYQIVSSVFDILAWLVKFDYFTPSDAPDEKQSMAYQRINSILEYVGEHYDTEISLKDIAAKEHISYFYLSSMFKRATGMSFREHLNNIRLYKSVKSLRDSKDSLEMIAAQYGFSNARSYTTMFVRKYGLSPLAYRGRHQPRTAAAAGDPHTRTDGNADDLSLIYDMLSTPSQQDTGAGKVWMEDVDISLHVQAADLRPLHHVWETIVTCGRASDLLRSEIRQLLGRVQREVGFRYLRFHGLFCDEMMILIRQPDGSLRYNWVYVDQILDFMQQIGIKPFLELSFMPTELASGTATVFWYRANITKPKRMEEWKTLVTALFEHCVERYGAQEVGTWYTEVWSEPDYTGSFWTGTLDEYLALYEASARAVKAVCPQVKVGGPAITSVNYAQTQWIRQFCQYCKRRSVPVDFVSFHAYADRVNSYAVKGDRFFPPMAANANLHQKMEEDLADLHIRTAKATGLSVSEFHVTEWNVSARHRFCIRDTAFMAPFVIRGALHCSSQVSSMAFWTLSDLIQEVNMPLHAYHGGMGMFNYLGIPKPTYLAFTLLKKLGDFVVAEGDNYIIARQGTQLQVLVYNIAYLDQLAQANTDFSSDYEGEIYALFEEKPALHVTVALQGCKPHYRLTRYMLDKQHGSAYDEWIAMGAVQAVEPGEVQYLNHTAVPQVSCTHVYAEEGTLRLECIVPVHGCCLMTLLPV